MTETESIWVDTTPESYAAKPATYHAQLSNAMIDVYIQPGGCLELTIIEGSGPDDSSLVHLCNPDEFIDALIALRTIVTSQRTNGWSVY